MIDLNECRKLYCEYEKRNADERAHLRREWADELRKRLERLGLDVGNVPDDDAGGLLLSVHPRVTAKADRDNNIRVIATCPNCQEEFDSSIWLHNGDSDRTAFLATIGKTMSELDQHDCGESLMPNSRPMVPERFPAERSAAALERLCDIIQRHFDLE